MVSVANRLLVISGLLLLLLKPALALDGEAQYKRYCSSCHGLSGEGRAGLGVSLRDSDRVKGDIQGTIAVVMNGSPGTLMVAFKRNLEDRQLAAVINYVRAAFGGDRDSRIDAADLGAWR